MLHLFGRQIEPFPAGVLLHSYLGSAEMVPGFANLGCYFSLPSFLTGMKSTTQSLLFSNKLGWARDETA
jgi:Tat protein secretion system quality control protein TatD with DNase activity